MAMLILGMQEKGEVMLNLELFIQSLNLDSHAVIGAVSGAMFFLMTPSISKKRERVAKTLISFVIGYSVGIAVGHDHAMWASIVASATGVLILSGVMKLLQKDDGLLTTLNSLVDLLKRFTK